MYIYQNFIKMKNFIYIIRITTNIYYILIYYPFPIDYFIIYCISNINLYNNLKCWYFFYNIHILYIYTIMHDLYNYRQDVILIWYFISLNWNCFLTICDDCIYPTIIVTNTQRILIPYIQEHICIYKYLIIITIS